MTNMVTEAGAFFGQNVLDFAVITWIINTNKSNLKYYKNYPSQSRKTD